MNGAVLCSVCPELCPPDPCQAVQLTPDPRGRIRQQAVKPGAGVQSEELTVPESLG